MRCRILHESAHRLRVRVLRPRVTPAEADVLEYYLRKQPQVREVRVYERTGDAVIRFGGAVDRQVVVEALARFDFEDEKAKALVPEHTSRELDRAFQDRLFHLLLGRVIRRFILPARAADLLTAVRSLRFLAAGLRCLASGKLEVPVLDAAAITASLLRRDFGTAGSVMFLLDLGELLEEWTRRKSVDDLASSMLLKVDQVWVRTPGGDVLQPVDQVKKGALIVLRTSHLIPLDSIVREGEVTVNQASMTGESVPVAKRPGGALFAGTVVEEGNCVAEVTKPHGAGKYDQILEMIEASEKLKSKAETKAYHMADQMVPLSLAGTAVSWLLTRNMDRALSFLMVDFSCALRLAMPLSVLSAMREAGKADISVKGGKFLEAAALADTVVFDKTGTLTRACPTLVDVVPFAGSDPTEDLRLAACLEEHYPNSILSSIKLNFYAKFRKLSYLWYSY